MKPSLSRFALLSVLSWPLAAVAQDSPQEPIAALIQQLGDADFQKREEAEGRLAEIGAEALPALEVAAKSEDAEIAFRSRQAIRRITSLSAEEQAEFRALGQAGFYAGDYEKMASCYRRLARVANASIEDRRWLGHACQLSSQWREAADAYSAVIDRMDLLLDRPPEQRSTGDESWPANWEVGVQQRAATILVTARLQRYCLNDALAAEKTLRRIRHYNDLLNEPLDEIEKKWLSRIAEAIALGKDVDSVGLDVQRSLSLRYTMMALRELAAVQQTNGNFAEALETWSRVHWTTHQFVGFTESIDAFAVSRLLQDLPDSLAQPAVPFVTFLGESSPSAEFDLADPQSLAKAYDMRQNYGTFALGAAKGLEFESLEFTCDIEQLEPQYGGQFSCWSLAGDAGQKKSIGDIYWPNGKPIGREKVSQKFSIEPGAGLVHFRAGSWKDKFKVYSVKVAATFRPRGREPVAPPMPLPGVSFHTEFLPPGGSVSIDGKPYPSDATTYDLRPGKMAINYAHPRLAAARRVELDLQPGRHYSLFVNLDSPFSGELTTLRGIDSTYGPSASFAKMADGRWLAAWCKTNGGLQFATSDDSVTWSEPRETSDAGLFNENYNCVAPTVYVDKAGTIWVAYFSNQLDIDQLNSGGYRLFLRSSKDGVAWSAPRPIRMELSGWPPGNLQVLAGPDGKTWVLYRLQYAAVDTLKDFTQFKDLEIPATEQQRSHARNPYASLDAAGRLHLVWDHFAQALCYSQRDRDGHWSEPVQTVRPDTNQQASHPQLIVRGDRIALIYRSHQGGFLRRGEWRDGAPHFDEPVKIAPHTAPLVSTTAAPNATERLELFTGGDTVWRLTATMDDLIGAAYE